MTNPLRATGERKNEIKKENSFKSAFALHSPSFVADGFRLRRQGTGFRLRQGTRAVVKFRHFAKQIKFDAPKNLIFVLTCLLSCI